MTAYERCLSIIPFHEEAKNSIEYIKNKQGLGRTNEVETIPLITPIKAQGVKEALKHLLVQHDGTKTNKKKKKKEKKYVLIIFVQTRGCENTTKNIELNILTESI